MSNEIKIMPLGAGQDVVLVVIKREEVVLSLQLGERIL